MKPSETFNNEDSNRSQNPDFNEVLSTRLSRRICCAALLVQQAWACSAPPA